MPPPDGPAPTAPPPAPEPKRSKLLRFDPQGIPQALRDHPHWLVCNRHGVPVARPGVGNSKASPEDWTDFATAATIATKEPGLWPYMVLTDGTPATVFDVDRKPQRETETTDEYTARIERAENSLQRLRELFPRRYESRSKSGNGCHIIVLGKFEGTGGKGRGEWSECEIYTRAHGVALTGHVVDGHDTPASYPTEDLQALRDEMKGGPPHHDTGDGAPDSPSQGKVRHEWAREVLAELAAADPRPDRDKWRDMSSAVFHGVGVETGIELLQEAFPEEVPGEYRKLAKSLKWFAPWETLRGFGVNPCDPETLPNGFSDLDQSEDEGEEESGTAKPSLRERAYALRFDPNDKPPPDEVCMMIGDYPVAARGNLTGVQGKSKVGKTAQIAAILGAAQRGEQQNQGDTFCLSWVGESTGAIIHLDTEQSRSDWHGLVSRSVTRSGVAEVSPRLVSLPLVMFARSERLEILRQTLAHEHREKGSIDLVVIDGVADLCKSPNDETEALELISQLMALSQKFNTTTVCVLHENPSTQDAKTRGHLGSELNRKAFANLRTDKDAETLVSTIYGTDMRRRDIPKDQGFCFAWNEAARMHTYQGRATGVKAAQRKSRAEEKARKAWEKIFETAEIGTNGICPDLTPEQAAEALRDISETKEEVNPETMKKRMQRAETLGVLRKTGAGTWSLSPAGQTGQIRDI